ncbi:hypothetical protein EL22_19645 [Halostagnicola sp. A56]|nr:hypothetical protein EL22_19645 [Halostagnicola sp. A56]
MIIGHIVTMVLDVIGDVPSRDLTNSVPASSFVLIFEWRTRLRTVDEVNCRTRKARVRSIEIEILEIKSTNRARTRARFPE